ncbi:hypothetical protein AKJ09_00763 [Labilithrix luteola]|uniref:Uncharacterized protein n=1 Tax=Labilithrix luteola TaxID=1391654 RepID=A0A0K1PLW1_9BACT|nr:hypothetical protein AKJ09_00763 [Labilithrix luteola]
MTRCWLPASFLAVATFALSSRASAEQAVALSWNAEPGCAPAAEVARRIDELVGPNHATEALVANVVITSRAERWHAAITLTRAGTSSERAVDGESCASVTDVAAVIVALAVDPSAAEPASEPPHPVPVVLTSAPPSQEKPALVERTPAPSIYTGASFLVDGAMLASTAAGAELFVGWRHRNLRVEADAAFLPPLRATLPTNGGEGAELWLLHGGTRACWLPIAGGSTSGHARGSVSTWCLGRVSGRSARRARRSGPSPPRSPRWALCVSRSGSPSMPGPER